MLFNCEWVWKSFFESFRSTLVSVLKSVWKIVFESFLKSVGVKRSFDLFWIRASIYESSTYPKELGCVNVLKVMPSHHWEVGSTTVGGVRVNSRVRDNVVTGAIVGHLRSYPYAMGHGHKDLLKRPILDDHVSRGKATVRRTLRVVCEFVYCFQLCFILSWYRELRVVFIFGHSFFHAKFSSFKGAEIKVRKIKSYAITRRGSIHRQINKDPFWIKMRKINKFLITITRLEQLHNIYKKKIRTNVRKEIRIEYSRALDPLKKLNEIKKIN